MVKRKADELIRNFILNNRRSLLVTGARQVGKTFSIRKVGKECFDNVVEINFDRIILYEGAGKIFSSSLFET